MEGEEGWVSQLMKEEKHARAQMALRKNHPAKARALGAESRSINVLEQCVGSCFRDREALGDVVSTIRLYAVADGCCISSARQSP